MNDSTNDKPEDAEQRSTRSLDRSLAFLSLTDEDAVHLQALLPMFNAYAEEFVEAFYKHLRSFPETAKFLQDEPTMQQLQQLQIEHFQSMLHAQWGADYARRRYQVGEAHAERGLDPELFLAAYNQYLQLCIPKFAEEHGVEAGLFLRRVLALWKSIFLDIGLTLNAYFTETTQDLRQALDMYWKANVELHHFAELTSHDLKTPLATVANLCDEVLDEFGEAIPDEAAELIQKARNRTFRMSTMIDELLAKTSPREHLDHDEVASTELALNEAVEQVRPMLEERGIHLKLPDSLPYVQGDAVRLREVLFNLLSNAAKYIEPSGNIEIRATITEEYCTIAIRDDGPGIPAEEQERIFAPFRRLPMHRDQTTGSGLGLYFTKNLVEHLRGKIWVDSELGHGSCFFVQLPRTDRHHDP